MHLHRWLLPRPARLRVRRRGRQRVHPEPDAGVDVPETPPTRASTRRSIALAADALPGRPARGRRARRGHLRRCSALRRQRRAHPVCSACTGADDCGPTASACRCRAALAPACRGATPDVPVCPGRLRCVRDVTLADVAVCAPLGGTCCLDGDNDGYGQGVGCMGPDCDDADPARTGAAMELCNNVDDDCDGVVDEELSRACSTACGAGTERCARGAWSGCTARLPTTEVCSNMMDDDCDGMTDEGCTRAATAAASPPPASPGRPSGHRRSARGEATVRDHPALLAKLDGVGAG
nr:hypothetical protein [Deltaproteobacteria bacterium]